MWAGVISRISNKIDNVFGKWVVKIFRSWNYNPKKDLSEYLHEDREPKNSDKQWKYPPFKVFLKPIFIVILLASTITFWIVFGVPSVSSKKETSSTDILTVLLSTGIGIAVAVKIKSLFEMVRKCL